MKQIQSSSLPSLSIEKPESARSYSPFLSLSFRFSIANGTSVFASPIAISFLLLLSLPIIFFLAPRILPPRQIPITPADELDDFSLFRRAAAVAGGGSRSSPRPKSFSHWGSSKPKIAFLFLTNSDLYFAPLWERFFRGHSKLYNVYVHADPSVKLRQFSGVFANRSIPARKTERSSATLISAERRLLAEAIIDDPANVYFALVSQHCIPLHSFRFVHRMLFSTPPIDPFDSGAEFYPSYLEILSKEPFLWNRYTARGEQVMLPEVKFSEFRVGSQFFVLTRKHAVLIIKERRLWKKFKLPCYRRQSCYPEEHYFPTLLSMKDPRSCTRYTLTNVNWTGTVNGHPHTYLPQEVSSQLIYDLRKSNYTRSYLFARKFSQDCLDPLMGLADTVIFRD